MRTWLDCLPCPARNAVDLARKSAQGDAELEARIAAEGMRILGRVAEAGYALPPPCYARQLIDNALAMCGGRVPDPWAEEKKTSTELALKLMERLDEIPGWDPDSFESCLRLSVAGNILDFSVYADLDIAAAMETMATAFTKPIYGSLGGSQFTATASRAHPGISSRRSMSLSANSVDVFFSSAHGAGTAPPLITSALSMSWRASHGGGSG